MRAFDQFDSQLNQLQDKFFSQDLIIKGEPTKGIFEEFPAEFVQVHDAVAMIDLPTIDLPEGIRRGDICQANGRSWTVKYSRKHGERTHLYLE